MSRRLLVLLMVVPCLLLLSGVAVLAGAWRVYTTPHVLGPQPTIAIVDGIIPVISNGTQTYKLTASGWESIEGLNRFICGDGVSRIVSNTQPVKFGRDGRFYSTSGLNPVRFSDVNIWEIVGLEFPGVNALGACSADPGGLVYAVAADSLGMTTGTDWQQFGLPLQANDLAISGFGDVAVVGYLSGTSYSLGVSWFDYKFSEWRTKLIADLPSPRKFAIEFDANGNLTVAYISASRELRLVTLQMSSGNWTDELVAQLTASPISGAVLGFDINNCAMLAAGNILAYNQPPIVSVRDAKVSPDDRSVQLTGAIVSSAWNNAFYMETADRSSGILVKKPAHGLTRSNRVAVKGMVNTDANGERYIQASSAVITGSGSVDPLGLPLNSLGGGSFLDPVTGFGQRGVADGSGLNNIGLLVRVWGNVVEVEPVTSPAQPTWFKIDDGSSRIVKCVAEDGSPVIDPLWQGKYASVTGVSSCEFDGENLVSRIRMTKYEDPVLY